MSVAWAGYPHSVSILRDTGIERIVTYHPTHQPTPNMTYISEFISDPCQGVYLKWLNKKSGYDYWLFNKEHIKSIAVQDRGRILNIDTNRPRALSATHSIGKEATTKVTVNTRVNRDRMSILKYVLVSPEVYLFNPQSILGSVTCAEFNKVFVDARTFAVDNTKNNSVRLRFTFEFDKHNVQSII